MVAVSVVVGRNDVLLTVSIDIDARISSLVRPKGIAQDASALVARVVLAVVERRKPLPALQQDDAQSGFSEFLGDAAAAGLATTSTALTCLSDSSVIANSRLGRSYRALARMGG